MLPAALPALMPSVPFCEQSKGKTGTGPTAVWNPEFRSPGVMWQLLFSSHLTPLPLFPTEPGLPPLRQTTQPTYNPSDYLE